MDVRRKHEPHLRARLLQALTDQDTTLRGLSADTNDDTTATVLQADLLIDGPAAHHLDALVTRLSLEPGVRTIAWKDQNPDPRDPDDRDDQPPRSTSRR